MKPLMASSCATVRPYFRAMPYRVSPLATRWYFADLAGADSAGACPAAASFFFSAWGEGCFSAISLFGDLVETCFWAVSFFAAGAASCLAEEACFFEGASFLEAAWVSAEDSARFREDSL